MEATLLPLKAPCPLALEKLDLDFDFRHPSRPGWVDVHLDARLSNPTPDIQEARLMLVAPENSVQLRWQGSPVDSERLVVPHPLASSEKPQMVAVQAFRLIVNAGQEGHLVADFRLPGLGQQGDRWDFLFRLPDRRYWADLGPTLLTVHDAPGLKVDRADAPLSTTDGVLGALIDPFHPREVHLKAQRQGMPVLLLIYLLATAVPLVALLLTLPVCRWLGRIGSFCVAAAWGSLLLWGARTLVVRQGWLQWSYPAGGWQRSFVYLCWVGVLLGAVMAGLAGWPSKRKNIQEGEGEARHA